MPQIIFVIIVFILVADFVLERFLSYLNIQNSKKTLPAELSDIYDNEKYLQQQDYFRTNSKFGMISGSFSFLITLSMYLFGGFGWLDAFLGNYIDNPILLSLAFFGVIFWISDLLGIPFELYDTFVIEQKFGFNKVTPKIFILDKLKSWLMSALLGAGLLSLIMWIYSLTPDYFWLLGWSVVTVFGLFMGLFYSELIVPMFNKQTPLEEGELRTAIEKFAGKAGFKTQKYLCNRWF